MIRLPCLKELMLTKAIIRKSVLFVITFFRQILDFRQKTVIIAMIFKICLNVNTKTNVSENFDDSFSFFSPFAGH